MRHKIAGVKLNRTTSHRQAMFRNMVTSLFKHERIRTTDVKAKELRRWADQIITLAKRGDLHARRQVMAIMREKDVVHKLFEDAAKRFGTSNGGYTRIVKVGRRPGDAAPISMIELISTLPKPKKGKKKTKVDKVEASKTEKTKAAADKAPVSEAKADAAYQAQDSAAKDEIKASPEQSDTTPAEQEQPSEESPAEKKE